MCFLLQCHASDLKDFEASKEQNQTKTRV